MSTIHEKREKKKDGRFQRWKERMFEPDGDPVCFVAMLVAYPPLFMILLSYVTRFMLSLPLMYLIVDPLVYICWENRMEKRRIERQRLEEEYGGDRTEIIRQKIEELREIERQAAEQEAAEAAEKAAREKEKERKKEERKQKIRQMFRR